MFEYKTEKRNSQCEPMEQTRGLILKLSFSHRYPGSGMILDCIDSWSLPSFLLCFAHANQAWLAVNHNTTVTSGEWILYSKSIAPACGLGSCQSYLCPSCCYERLQKKRRKDLLKIVSEYDQEIPQKPCFENVNVSEHTRKCHYQILQINPRHREEETQDINSNIAKAERTLRASINRLYAYCKGGNFNIHIWAWFGYFIC